MILSIEFSSHARKYLKKCEKSLSDRLGKRIEMLAIDPFPTDSIRVKGQEGKVFRIRVGDYRIIYKIYYDINTLMIFKIDKRERIYD